MAKEVWVSKMTGYVFTIAPPLDLQHFDHYVAPDAINDDSKEVIENLVNMLTFIANRADKGPDQRLAAGALRDTAELRRKLGFL